MANLNSASDCLKLMLQQVGENPDGSSSEAPLALQMLNTAYLDILSGGPTLNMEVGNPWTWARARTRKTLVLRGFFESNITLTNGSASATLGTAPGAGLGSFRDRHVKLDDEQDVYKISAHTAGATAVTLESEWLGETGVYASKCIKLIYDIGTDVLRMCAPIQCYRFQGFRSEWDGKIHGCDIDTLLDNYPIARLRQEVPDRFAELYKSETEHLLQFSSYVEEDMKTDFDYIPYPEELTDSKDSIPIIPYEKRQVLVDAASYFFAMQKNSANKDEFLQRAQVGLKAMQRADSRQKAHVSRTRGQIIPRPEQLNRTRTRGVS